MSGARFKYDDLPPHVKAQVDSQMANEKKPCIPVLNESKGDTPGYKRKMTKTELAFESQLVRLYGRDLVRFEALMFRMANGHRYTPDFYISGKQICFEVKGTCQLFSHARARLAFDQAKVEFPEFKFIWAEKQKDGSFKQQ